MKIPILYIVIPCYNEEKVLPVTSPMFLNKLEELINKKLISSTSKILFVNDGSKDSTWTIIKELSQKNESFIGISQSRNRGHQNAVLVLIGCWCVSIKAVLNKKVNIECLVMLTTIIGITIFELLFEARARYLYIYVPIYILIFINYLDPIKKKGIYDN